MIINSISESSLNKSYNFNLELPQMLIWTGPAVAAYVPFSKHYFLFFKVVLGFGTAQGINRDDFIAFCCLLRTSAQIRFHTENN